ncbi:MAG: GrpB family protein [Gemmatimonadaceae bacterium]|nr:GrpB family protein [Gemmatimonadaceae bacterium]
MTSLLQNAERLGGTRFLFGAPPVSEAKIEVIPYSPAWPRQFESESVLLAAALQPWLAGTIEHIGSTAVPGLWAKPVIDIMAPVKSLAESRAAIPAAEALGYVYFPYKSEVMHWFCKPSSARRTHHLHLVPVNSDLWRARLAFRDALRKDPRLAADYQALKLHLAALHPVDREAYTEAKAPFIQSALAALTTQFR